MKIKKQGFEVLDRPLEQKINIELETSAGLLSLSVDPLPIGFYDRMSRLFVLPEPPISGFARNKKGKLERDENGQPIKLRDEENEEYLEKKAKVQQRQNTYILYSLLSSDPDIEFNTEILPSDPDIGEKLEVVYQELADAGMSEGQQFQILTALNKASGLDEYIQDAKKN